MLSRFRQLARTGLCAFSFFSIGLVVESQADPIQYSTQAQYRNVLPSGSLQSYISFQGVANGSFDGNAPFSLGNLVVTAPSTLTQLPSVDKQLYVYITFDHDAMPWVVSLTLDGSVGPGGHVQAVINGIAPSGAVIPEDPHLPTTFSSQNISIDRLRVGGPLELNSSYNGASVAIYANVVPAPEPATASLFLALGAGLGLRAWRRSRRHMAPPCA